MNEATIDTDRSPLWLELVVLIASILAAIVAKYLALPPGCSGLTRSTVSDPTSPTYADRRRP